MKLRSDPDIQDVLDLRISEFKKKNEKVIVNRKYCKSNNEESKSHVRNDRRKLAEIRQKMEIF